MTSSSGAAGGRRDPAGTTARNHASAVRTAQHAADRRRRIGIVAGATVVVLAVLAGIVVLGVRSGTSRAQAPAAGRTAAPAALVAAVSGVPAGVLSAVGSGTSLQPPRVVSGPALTRDGRPEVLYIGAEFCPYCAAERWPLVQALSRFGSFTGLSTVASSATDVYPNTATFSTYGATYTSSLLSLVGREVEDGAGRPLDAPTAAEDAVWKQYTGQGSFPFLDLGGRAVLTAPQFDPAVLQGKTPGQIAAALADPRSPVAQAVDGAANVLTAQLCRLTAQRPAEVCRAVAGRG